MRASRASRTPRLTSARARASSRNRWGGAGEERGEPVAASLLGFISIFHGTFDRTQGNLNSLTSIFVPFEEPAIRLDAVAGLNSEVPGRLISWGEFHLPWHLTLSPVADIHTGFPYSNVDALQNYTGEPNGQRFPSFFSLDARVYRECTVPVPFISRLKNHTFRFGLYSINITNHSNPRDVFSDVASPYFGHFVGFQHRVDGLVIDFAQGGAQEIKQNPETQPLCRTSSGKNALDTLFSERLVLKLKIK